METGRALRATVEEMTVLDATQHRLVSLIGNIAPDGSASFFDVIMRIADKVRARHYPVPVLSETTEMTQTFHMLPQVRRVHELARVGGCELCRRRSDGRQCAALGGWVCQRR